MDDKLTIGKNTLLVLSKLINGVDPDDCASLIYSFANLADAEKELAKQKEIEAKITEQYGFCSSFCSLVDGGQAEIFIRQVMW